MRRAPLVERRPTPPALAAYVAIVVVVGTAALAWSTATSPLGPGIAADGLPAFIGDPRTSGLVFWIALGLLGSTRTRGMRGRAVLTFHLPFIVAAMTLGGPVAGGWVAAISSIELREIREVPWFGTLSNHAILALAGVVGGLVVADVRGTLGAIAEPGLATLAAAACGTFVFCAIDVGLTAVVVGLKERLRRDELASVFDSSFRQTMGGEAVLGWLLAVSYHTIGWWAPIVCAVLVLVVWRANDEHELTTHDALTGLLNRRGFEERWRLTLGRVRRGRHQAVLVMVDLDGFKGINDRLGHATGDEVLQQAARRLRASIRYTDVAARLGGDEFVLLLGGVPDRSAAERVVIRVHERLVAPLVIDVREPADPALEPGPVDVGLGASFGLVYLDQASSSDAIDAADRAMYQAKRDGGGVEATWVGVT